MITRASSPVDAVQTSERTPVAAEIARVAARLFARQGYDATSGRERAEASGITKPTLYYHLGSKQGLGEALVLRETDRFLGSVEEAVRGRADDPLAAIESGLRVFFTGAADNVMVKAILQGRAAGELLSMVTTEALPVIRVAEELLTGVMAELWPQIRTGDARLFAASIVRLAISHITTPTGDPETTVKDITRLLTPFVSRALSPHVEGLRA